MSVIPRSPEQKPSGGVRGAARRRAPRIGWRALAPSALHLDSMHLKRPHIGGWRLGRGWLAAGVALLAVCLFLALFDWNWLRGPIGGFASARTGREVRIEGDLKVRLLTLTPTVQIGGLRIGNPAWAPRERMAQVRNIAVQARLLPLLSGRLVLPLVLVEQPDVSLFRDASGRANWDFSTGAKTPAKPLRLPPIQTFVIADGRIRALDLGRRLSFAGTINARERRAAAYDRGFRLEGRGELNRRTFRLDVTGGPLINVRRDRPYPFDAQVSAGATRVAAKGQVPRPFDLGVVGGTVSISGRDLNDLYDLTGLALPNTPPYRVSGQFRRDGAKYRYTGFSGRVGASDISGDAAVDVTSGRPFLTAELRSRRLDFADLASIFGAPGASRAAAPEQKAEVRALAAQGRLLPDATLQTERIRGMDAKVTYAAAEVRAPGLPLRTVELGVDLDHGVLKLDPIAMRFPSGRLTGEARIDARRDTPVSAVDLRVSDVRLEQFIPPVDGARPVSGTLLARARLTGAGNSVHRAAASSDGAVTVVIPRGEMRQAFAELMGIDVTKGLFLLLDKDQTPTDVRCAVANFRVSDGVLRADRIVFDTGVVRVEGEGTVDLATERMDLIFRGKPKKLRAVRAIAPITVGGVLRRPSFGVDPGGVVAQAGVGALLASVLSPLAAILPFVDPGLEKDANCSALLAEARTTGAPVAARPAAR